MVEINIIDPHSYAKATIEECRTVLSTTNRQICRACGKRSVIKYERQDRCADEGTCTVYRCTEPSCGEEWKH